MFRRKDNVYRVVMQLRRKSSMHIGKKKWWKGKKLKKCFPVKKSRFPTPGYTATPSTTSKPGRGRGLGWHILSQGFGCRVPGSPGCAADSPAPLAFSDEENSFKPYHLLTLQAQLPHESTHGVRRDRSTHRTCGLWAANKQFITPETS